MHGCKDESCRHQFADFWLCFLLYAIHNSLDLSRQRAAFVSFRSGGFPTTANGNSPTPAREIFRRQFPTSGTMSN